MKSAYVDVKCKITGEQPQPEPQPGENPGEQNQQNQENQGNQENQENKPLVSNEAGPSDQPVSTENLDNAQNLNQDNPNAYPNL
jgi:hypothetical protein